jgi:RimJ/RimL family protein N-acetyltransferase
MTNVIDPVELRLRDGRAATIRLAVPDDAKAITDFVNIVGREGRWVLRERATWSLEEERKTLGAADGRESAFFIAEIEGRLSGNLNIARGRWPKNAHVAEFGMACLPDCRRVGLGTALLRRALDWARSVGVRKVTLEVFATNEPAIGLYRKMGFEEEGRRHREFLIDGSLTDGVLMALWL